MPDARALMAQTLATEFGLPILFLRAGGKRPKYEGQFEVQATLDVTRIQRELGGPATANYGIAFGPAAGCFALDVDAGGAFTIASLEAELGPLPVTWRIITQSGNYQDLFDWPSDDGPPIRNRGRFAPGLDVRGSGGQSVGPLSEFVDPETGEVRSWTWAPGRSPWDIPRQPMPAPWLGLIRRHAARPPEDAPRRPAPPQARNRLEAFAASVMDAKLAALASAPDGEQELRLGAAALKAGSLVARGWISRSYCEQALVSTLMGCRAYDPGDPWTYGVATYKTARAIERGLASPEPDPAWVAQIEARDERPRDHLTAIDGGKASGSGSPPGADPAEADDRFLLDPFAWEDPADIPTRQWLYGRHYIRRYVSCTIAPPGTGKSMLALQEAICMASGKPLLGVGCPRLRVGYWNGEDPQHENRLRAAAVAKHHKLAPADLEGWLHWGSGRTAQIVLARTAVRGGAVEVDETMVARLIHTIRGLKLDVLIIDPYVSSHRVPENDNMAQDLVVKTWARIAEVCDTSVELVHHPRKTNGEAVTIEDSRGGGALVAGARVVRLLNPMTEAEETTAGLDRGERLSRFRIDHGKANLAPASTSTWMRFISIDLENGPPEAGLGDSVGVILPWMWPNALEGVRPEDVLRVQRAVQTGMWREDPRANEWVGYCVAEVLRIDLNTREGMARVKAMIKRWRESGLLAVEVKKDAQSRSRPFVVVGTWMPL